MSDAELVDEGDRTRIREDLETRFAVDAGAGSGKTRSLVDRVVTLVSRGATMSSIAAITFTEAAAAELRQRIREGLEERGATDKRCAVAAREADDAAVCTIHAFALRILSEHWLEAGLPPALEVLDAAGDFVDHATSWRGWLDALLGEPGAMAVLVRAVAAGLRLRAISEVARVLGDHHERLSDTVLARLDAERAERRSPPLAVGPIVSALEGALGMAERCMDPDDHLLAHLTGPVAKALRRLREAEGLDDATVIGTLIAVGRLTEKNGRKAAWGECIEDVRRRCEQAEGLRTGMLRAVVDDAVADLTARVARWVLDGVARRRAQGRLSYHDLLVEAVRLLGSHDDVRRAVRDRYRYLLIDEFQDTDPLQADLARLIGAPDAPGEPARLFVVGDPAQSIYRFRGADVEQFETMVAELDEPLSLTANFRSVPAILAFVDDVFERLPEVPHRPLVAVRSPLDDGPATGPPVAVFGGPDPDGKAKDVRLRSAAQVAAVIGRIRGEGWSVDTPTGVRPAGYRDIAVLLPTRTSLPTLERAFDTAEVPYRLEGATLVWGSQDVRDLLATLRAVEHPSDPLAVLGALRTPALACGDDDLLRYKGAGGSWDPRSQAPGTLSDDDPVVRAMGLLAALHTRRMWSEPSALVAAVLDDLHFFELALVHRRPRDHWHRLRWVLDQARAFDEARGGSLGEFLDWVEATEEAEPWSSSLGPPDPDDDAVRVMTIHGAKGLEFPVVVLTGLDVVPSGEPARVLFDDRGLPRVRFSADIEAPEHHGLGSLDKALDEAERFRLLYVALTRPRDHLVVDLHHKESNKFLARRLFGAVAGGAAAAWIDPGWPPEPAAPAAASHAGSDRDRAWWVEHWAWWEERQRLLADSAHQPAWSATALARAAVPSVPAPARRAGGAPDPETQRRIGRAVHDALARVDLPPSGTASADHLAVAASSAESQHLDGADATTAVGLFERALASPTVRALAAGRHWKELALAAPLPGGSVLEGFADLVGESPDGLVVVDFKTAPGGPASEQHLGQVAAYAYALGQATGRTVAKVSVLTLEESGSHEQSLEGTALAEAVARVLAAARG